jgi:hypothetical protein
MNHQFSPLAVGFGSFLAICGILIPAAVFAQTPPSSQLPFVPDPLAVSRHATGWSYPQAGWIVVHIEGTPYDRGYQHGRLLAREIVDYCQTIAKIRNHQSTEKAWNDLRLFVNALFLRRFDQEYLREMQGIADGAAAAGAKLDGRLVDLIDIAVINSDIELGFLEAAIERTATGIERERFRGRHGSPPRAPHHERCSAFVATGPATADGEIVAGHITMSDLCNVRFFNIWLDIQPSTGSRMVFQTFPGGIQSGMDYYINSAGLIVSETTVEQTKFNVQGEMLASRIRRAIQYADSIDRCAEILTSSNNGLYTNQWLIGDIKTNEIAMLELGTDTSRLRRGSRNEWVGGTAGFYWGCNNVQDLGVFKETVADLGGKPANLVLHPRTRDEAWIKLFKQRKGRMNEAFGFEAFSTPPLVGYPSCDAKFTTAALAKDLKSWAFFGPPLGRTLTPSEADRDALPSVQPFVAHEWTQIDVQGVELPPAKTESTKPQRIADAAAFPKKDEPLHVDFEANHPFAWRGTLLPKTNADIWLAAAFAEYEKVVALEQAIAFHDDSHTAEAKDTTRDKRSNDEKRAVSASHDEPSRAGQDLVDLALFQHKSNWLTAIRRVGADIPLKNTQPDLANGDWYRIAVGKGVMLLDTLRAQIGAESFARYMDEFGVAHAGQEVTTEQFRQHLKEVAGSDALETLDRWLTTDITAQFKSHNPWTIFSHEVEPEQVLIVYGTLHNQAAQKEAAEHLQSEVVRRFANVWPPMKSDREVTDDELKSRYLLLVGHPFTNRVSAKILEKSPQFPVQFGRQSFSVGGETFANPESWIVAAGENPFNPRYSAVIFSGLNAASTWRSVRDFPDSEKPNPQIMLGAAGKQTRLFCIRGDQ